MGMIHRLLICGFLSSLRQSLKERGKKREERKNEMEAKSEERRERKTERYEENLTIRFRRNQDQAQQVSTTKKF